MPFLVKTNFYTYQTTRTNFESEKKTKKKLIELKYGQFEIYLLHQS